MRTLTTRELNRALLARQLLLRRRRSSLPEVLELMAGLQAQYAPAIYVGLWSRAHGLRRHAVTRALEARAIVQGTLLRSTIHVVSAADYWPFAVAVREERRRGWLKATGHAATEDDLRAAAAAVTDRLRDRQTLTRPEIEALVGERAVVNGVGLWVDLVRVPPSGTWERRRADRFGLAEDWLGPCPPLDRPAARALVVRRYLAGFGPARPRDVADWAGLPVAAVQETLAGMDLRRFETEAGEVLVDLPGAPLPGARTRAPVRFLPVWDATLLVHARRTQILPEEYRALVFNVKTPHSVATFLVDGSVAGTWRYEGGRVVVAPFAPLPAAAMREVEEESRALAAFHA